MHSIDFHRSFVSEMMASIFIETSLRDPDGEFDFKIEMRRTYPHALRLPATEESCYKSPRPRGSGDEIGSELSPLMYRVQTLSSACPLELDVKVN